jgi:CHAT domain-containing protein
VLGYRWVVTDESALSLAAAFYDGLFRTLSPSSALFQARSELAMRELGWNDETWLSPILVEQNP